MVQLKIAFLDEEEAYLERLKGYLIRKKEKFFIIQTFTCAKYFLESKERETFDAVVMTAVFWEAVRGGVGQAKMILFCEGIEEAPQDGCFYVRKYQSAERLFCQISAMLWQKEEKDMLYFPQETAQMIGVYSPARHEDQILFSMTMAQILGETQKVLYVNLMGHSGFYGRTKSQADEDIGDLIYGMMQEGHDFAAGLHRIRLSYRNFDYIPPAVNPEHLSEISKPLYEKLLVSLKGRSGYDVVLVDFGEVFLGFAEMMPVFDCFYCLGKEGTINCLRTDEFLEYLSKEGDGIIAHVNRLMLPGQMQFAKEKDASLLENSLYGGIGDYIRNDLYGGAKIGQ